MYFPSKRDAWLAGVLGLAVVVLISTMLLLLREPETWLWSFLMIPPVALIAWIWFTTGYTFAEADLVAQSGPFRWSIPLAAITTLQRTRNPLSAPALSLDRLEIRYGDGQMLLVSPEDDLAFVQMIRQRCPHANIDLL